jgi:hypothetical protein
LDSWRRHFRPYNKSSHSILNDGGGGVENFYRAFVLFITPHSKLTEVVSVTPFPTPYNVSLIIPPSSFTAGRLRCVRPGECIEGSRSSSFCSNYRGSGESLFSRCSRFYDYSSLDFCEYMCFLFAMSLPPTSLCTDANIRVRAR